TNDSSPAPVLTAENTTQPAPPRHPARVGDERRHPAGALRDQRAAGVGQPDREIVVLVDVGAECGALDVGVDLVRDRDETVTDHFKSDRVDGERGVGTGDVLHGASPFFRSDRPRASGNAGPTRRRRGGPCGKGGTSRHELVKGTVNAAGLWHGTMSAPRA